MGMMDDIKRAQEMAQQAMQQGGAGQMSPSAGDVEYANLAMKLNQNGLPGVATVNSITESGAGSDPVNKAYDIAVSVELQDGQGYDTVVHQYLTADAVNAYQPGKRFEVKADPDDTSKVMLYGYAD
ncbi:MAG TPA: hypothetical protein VFN15_04665 [Solirubrobacterales bacterium]|nr:hypothetical protein [Solirubrobacterales bacterium]